MIYLNPRYLEGVPTSSKYRKRALCDNSDLRRLVEIGKIMGMSTFGRSRYFKITANRPMVG